MATKGVKAAYSGAEMCRVRWGMDEDGKNAVASEAEESDEQKR